MTSYEDKFKALESIIDKEEPKNSLPTTASYVKVVGFGNAPPLGTSPSSQPITIPSNKGKPANTSKGSYSKEVKNSPEKIVRASSASSKTLDTEFKNYKSQLSGWSDEPTVGGNTPPFSSTSPNSKQGERKPGSAPSISQFSIQSNTQSNVQSTPQSATQSTQSATVSVTSATAPSSQKQTSELSVSSTSNTSTNTTNTTPTPTINPTTTTATSNPSTLPVIDKSKLTKEERRALYQQQAQFKPKEPKAPKASKEQKANVPKESSTNSNIPSTPSSSTTTPVNNNNNNNNNNNTNNTPSVTNPPSTPVQSSSSASSAPGTSNASKKIQKQPTASKVMQFDDSKKRAKADKKKILQLQPSQKIIPLFAHLPQYERGSSLSLNVGFGDYSSSNASSASASSTSKQRDIHPAILELGLKYTQGSITGSNARCVAMLSAFKKVIEDFNGGLLFKDFEIKPLVQFLVDCRPISISMGNAINYLKMVLAATKKHVTLEESKTFVINRIDTFIQERIVAADEMIIKHALSKIKEGDVILTYARSHVVELLLKKAFDDGKQFRVIVVDSRPKKEGKELLKRLVKHGIKCTYVLINAISYIMKEVSKVFVGAYTMMANGNLISRTGTAVIALMAQNYQVPFIACCETYKFTERVQLESISFNELGDPDVLKVADGGDEGESSVLKDWKEIPSLKLLNLVYDLTPSEFITMVITEVGMLPPSSVPVILREYRTEPSQV